MSEDPKFYEDLLIKFMYIKKEVREKILPHLDADLFDRDMNKNIVNHILSFVEKYDVFPKAHESLLKLKEETRSHFKDVVMNIDCDKYNNDLLMDELEGLIKGKMISNVCFGTMMKLSENPEDGFDKTSTAPDKLREAYSFSFHTDVGLDLFESEERMYNHFHEKKHIIPTNIIGLNRLIGGGLHAKSLLLFMAETNMGKSLVMSSMAVGNVMANKNVLYVSAELSEDGTGERMIANLFDIPLDDLKAVSKERFHLKYEKLKKEVGSKIIVREFPAKGLNVNDIRNLLKELEMKKKFVPDIIYIDQIGNMNSIHRIKSDNTYTEMGKVTQEVRGLATEVGVPIVSAIQTNRDGFGSSEIDLTNTGDSLGYVQTADVVVAITQSEEFRAQGKFIWSILKNRFGINKMKLTVNVSYEKMAVTDDEDALAEIQYNGAKAPETTKEKAQKENDAVSFVSDIIDEDEDETDRKFKGWS